MESTLTPCARTSRPQGREIPMPPLRLPLLVALCRQRPYAPMRHDSSNDCVRVCARVLASETALRLLDSP
eukprot:15312561-Alexandrium_andersonii.AAC.1